MNKQKLTLIKKKNNGQKIAGESWKQTSRINKTEKRTREPAPYNNKLTSGGSRNLSR